MFTEQNLLKSIAPLEIFRFNEYLTQILLSNLKIKLGSYPQQIV